MSYSLCFGIRADRPNKNGEVAIFLRYTFKRRWVNIALKKTINPQFWSNDGAKPKISYPQHRQLFGYMKKFEEEVQGYVDNYFEDFNEYPVVDLLKGKRDFSFKPSVKPSKRAGLLIAELYQSYFNEKLSDGHKKSTLNVYKSTLDKWSLFSNKKYLYVTDMSFDVLQKFRQFLMKEGLKENTIGKYIKTIKSFLNYCYYQKEITAIPISFKKVNVDKETGTDIVHLKADELELVKREVFYSGWYGEPQMNLTDREKLIGQIFVFLCSTGFSYADFLNLRLHHIHIERDGLENEKYVTLEISRQKLRSVHQSIIPILDVTIDVILEWLGVEKRLYNYDTTTLSSKKTLLENILKSIGNGKMKREHHPRLVKYVSAVSFNREIKGVLEKIGLTRSINAVKRIQNKKIEEIKPLWKAVTSHTGRRTFVTLSLEQGVSMHHLMLATGHLKVATLLEYNKTSRRSVYKEFEGKVKTSGTPA